MIRLRKLKLKDASLMLEWMHDKSVVENMKINFAEKTIEDCEKFIYNSWDNPSDLHLAITDDSDIYMGTVSLKHITQTDAEFAISIRKVAMGKGIAKKAMEEILEIGLYKMNLQQIYWCVALENKRAVRFYEKNGYHRADVSKIKSIERYENLERYIWYQYRK